MGERKKKVQRIIWRKEKYKKNMEEISIIICLEEKKQRLKEYQTDFCEAKKSQFSDQYISKVKPK